MSFSFSSQEFGSSAGFSSSASFGGASSSVSQIAQDLLALQRSGASSFGASGASTEYVSSIEQAILGSQSPINIQESEEITVLGNRGIFANKQEVASFRGPISIEQYQINDDSNPQVINKKARQQLEYVQELAIRYLRPPTPPAPGEIVIVQEGNSLTPPAPPVIIRQQPARPGTPEPLVVREAPPQPPKPVGRKLITISGKRLPPPPRKVIIERLAPLPSKPQSVIIERWLPYAGSKRRVIFQKSAQQDPVIVKPRNVIVQWEAPSVSIRKEVKYLGVIRANPAEYVQRYGSSLKSSSDLPSFVTEIKTPEGVVLAANHQASSFYELEGDVQALKLIDLDREGLSEYRAYLQRLGILGGSSSSGAGAGIEEIFRSVDSDNNGRISINEAEKLVLKLNSRLGRRYGEDDVRAFFSTLDVNNDGTVELDEFRRAFLNLGL